MSYLKFDKEELVNLEYSLQREFLRTNRSGAYSSSTLAGCNTRKYHGMLIVQLDELDGGKHVLLSALDETIIQHDTQFNLGIHKYPGEFYEPKGHKYIRNFEIEHILASGTNINLNYYIDKIIDEDKQEEVYEYFKEAKTDSIQDALRELGENIYSEEEMRLMRIKFMSEYGN